MIKKIIIKIFSYNNFLIVLIKYEIINYKLKNFIIILNCYIKIYYINNIFNYWNQKKFNFIKSVNRITLIMIYFQIIKL